MTLNWSEQNKDLRGPGSLTIWFDPDMIWAAQPNVRRGRKPFCDDAAAHIPADQSIASVTANGTDDTGNSHDAIVERGAHAVIPPRKNAKPKKSVTAGAIARSAALRASKYLSRALSGGGRLQYPERH